MSDDKRKLSDWYVPPDCVAHVALLMIAFVGMLSAMLLPALNAANGRGDNTLAYVALSIGLIGVILLFLARLPLYRQRRFFTFGSRTLDDSHKRLYRWAYRFIGASVLLLMLLLSAIRPR